MNDDDLDEEFDAMLARHDLAVPESLRPGTYAGYRELRRLADLLSDPRLAQSEPAAVYRMRQERQ